MLSLICKRKDLIDRDGLVEFFQPLTDSITEINHNPIMLSNGYKVHTVISSVVADNPASNELNGICMSFRWKACRRCEVYLEEIRPNNLINLRSNSRATSEEQIFKDTFFEGNYKIWISSLS